MIQRLFLFVTLHFISCSDGPAAGTEKDIKKRDYSAFHQEAKEYCKKEKFNEDYYFLIDLSVHSGKNRFYIYDFKTKKISDQKLVTHGSCDVDQTNDTKWEKAKFSNKDNSHCSSKGKYKIGRRDSSTWGIKIKYWLHGLEAANSNAVNRVIVLHSWTAVSNTEVFPRYSPLSWGCPAVSDDFMKLLDKKLQKTDKPVLLWIVE